MKHELIATTTFGLEAVCKRELQDLGFTVKAVDNGKVTFLSDEAGIAKANIWIRTADRILLKVGEFKAVTFDQLFDQVFALPWQQYLEKDAKFVVNGKSVKSKLFSIRDCQKISEKAIAKKLLQEFQIPTLTEEGALYPIMVSLLNDLATITIDTSGDGLHKRGYRVETVEAPIKETLAAAMILLSYWNKDRVLYDVFCGSGTIPIEAALIGRNIAPGLNRDFTSKHWSFISSDIWKLVTREAYQAMNYDQELYIFASDISKSNLEKAMLNAEEAGVEDAIVFRHSDFRNVPVKNDYGIVISNPPYGERLMTKEEVHKLYFDLGNMFNPLNTWSKYFLTSYEEFEKAYHKKADRQRKLYNGKLETRYYQYYGPRPKQ